MFRASSCDPGWAQFGEKCFKLLPRNDFDGGHKACERSNATVASVHSQDENAFITKLAHDMFGTRVEFYIGLEYSRRDKLWHWVDGSDVDYDAWQPGEPNNALGDEYCGEVWHEGPWNDLPCRYRRPTMCQKKVAN
ncbi:C-type lectin 13 [Aphelenchoides avenae]|nr:C-type lectin 13 [Aphelenchus avenae]